MIAYLLGMVLGAAPATAAAATATAPPAAASVEPAGSWVVRDVTVIPADTDEVLAHRTVLIRDGKIARILPPGAVAKVKDASVVDGRGKFLVPGFVDAHLHLATEGAIRGSKDATLSGLDLGRDHRYDRQVMLSLLKAGVTGAANLGGSVSSDDDLLWLRGEIDAGRIDGPKLYVGKLINGPRAAVAAKPEGAVPASKPEAPTTAADGVTAVRRARERGYDFIKPYQFLNRETYLAVVEESKRQGFITTGHLPQLGCGTCADRDFTFAHPMTNVAHIEELARFARFGSDLAPKDIDALAQAMVDSRMSVSPGLITLKTIVGMYVQREVPPVPGEWLKLVDPVTRREWAPPANRYLSQAFRDQENADRFSAGYDFGRVLARELWKRGVGFTVGTDAPLPGLPFGVSAQQEMIELREIGLKPVEVLRAASINAHRLFDPGAGSGAVREGERANLVLLNADPLADVQNVAKIDGVFAQGRWLSMEQIDRKLAEGEAFQRDLERQLQARKPAAP
ncbi:amidohydrolase family protein [Lysobacter gummosus]|uniref:Amidohydrolase family protein n=1 Tax=Lysobacter gummosus TaxID=262324 RepID=A0ABY3XDF7_9GAMM|nr:amidohydrolase family protein [Lysobacter gummosus]ALN93269.1 amidohydrolase family protein [Lysobacter gummosus]UNP28760.1 amidohydrolase family protein [Lysobacter gummosus]